MPSKKIILYLIYIECKKEKNTVFFILSYIICYSHRHKIKAKKLEKNEEYQQ